jgi:hypothetical protein
MPRRWNVTRAAKALVDADFTTDKESAQLNGCSVRSIESWRSKMNSDEALRTEYQRLLNLKLGDWAELVPVALAHLVGFSIDATRSLDPSNPESVAAVTGAMKVLGELQLTRDMIALRNQ